MTVKDGAAVALRADLATVGTRLLVDDNNAAAFRATFLARLRTVDPDAAVSDMGTMREFLEASLGPRRFNLALFGAFATAAVLLAVLGLYGVVSYSVSQRAPEIGLRIAIGATEGDVRRLRSTRISEAREPRFPARASPSARSTNRRARRRTRRPPRHRPARAPS